MEHLEERLRKLDSITEYEQEIAEHLLMPEKRNDEIESAISNSHKTHALALDIRNRIAYALLHTKHPKRKYMDTTSASEHERPKPFVPIPSSVSAFDNFINRLHYNSLPCVIIDENDLDITISDKMICAPLHKKLPTERRIIISAIIALFKKAWIQNPQIRRIAFSLKTLSKISGYA